MRIYGIKINNINKAHLYFSLYVFVLFLGCRQLKSRPQKTRSSIHGPHHFSLRAEEITVVSGLRKEPRLIPAPFCYPQPSELEGKASQPNVRSRGVMKQGWDAREKKKIKIIPQRRQMPLRKRKAASRKQSPGMAMSQQKNKRNTGNTHMAWKNHASTCP